MVDLIVVETEMYHLEDEYEGVKIDSEDTETLELARSQREWNEENRRKFDRIAIAIPLHLSAGRKVYYVSGRANPDEAEIYPPIKVYLPKMSFFDIGDEGALLKFKDHLLNERVRELTMVGIVCGEDEKASISGTGPSLYHLTRGQENLSGKHIFLGGLGSKRGYTLGMVYKDAARELCWDRTRLKRALETRIEVDLNPPEI